jgi:chemotaxis regulatin CheY-phosphate phosphatase CheZ
MSQPDKPVLSEADFEAIAAAVNETERGRWFLAEYARRNRHADTERVLEAVARLERSLASRSDAAPAETIRSTIADMAEAIARTKAEIAAIRPSEDNFGTISNATIELDAIVSTTELATSEILASAERVQEISWTLREQGLEPSFCDQLDGLMTQTYQACSFQDLTGQRIAKVIETLQQIEARVARFAKVAQTDDADAARAPARAKSNTQAAVDKIIGAGAAATNGRKRR